MCILFFIVNVYHYIYIYIYTYIHIYIYIYTYIYYIYNIYRERVGKMRELPNQLTGIQIFYKDFAR